MAVFSKHKTSELTIGESTFYFTWHKEIEQWEAYCYAGDNSHHILADDIESIISHVRASPDVWLLNSTTIATI